MTQEEKELVLKDICARLPYGVHVEISWEYSKTDVYTGLEYYEFPNIDSLLNMFWDEKCISIKPYLRPLSSMTEEERTEFSQLIDSRLNGVDWKPWSLYDKTGIKNGIGGERLYLYDIDFIYDYLNVHHFDYRGLIEKGLALEATKGMYKTE